MNHANLRDAALKLWIISDQSKAEARRHLRPDPALLAEAAIAANFGPIA